MAERLTEAFAEIAALALRLGVENVVARPGCWECRVDERWWFAVNAHPVETQCSASNVPVPPYHAYVQFNGWPAGVISPFGGVIAAGEATNEDAFIAALKAAGRNG